MYRVKRPEQAGALFQPLITGSLLLMGMGIYDNHLTVGDYVQCRQREVCDHRRGNHLMRWGRARSNSQGVAIDKFEAMVMFRINKEKPVSYASIIQEVMLPKERSPSSEDRMQRFMSEYILSKHPWQVNDEEDCFTTLLSQELQEQCHRMVLSLTTDVEDQCNHNHIILLKTVYSMIQEALLLKEDSSSSEGGRQIFFSEYKLSKHSSLKNVEDHCMLQKTVYHENPDAPHRLLLRPANYPQVVAQLPLGGRDEGDINDIEEKKMRKLKYRSILEIYERMDGGVEGTGISADPKVTDAVGKPKDVDGEVVSEEEHQKEVVREGQKEEYQEQKGGGEEQCQEEDDEAEVEEVVLDEKEEAIAAMILDELEAMIPKEAAAVVAELADELELEEFDEELIKSLEFGMVDEVKERVKGSVGRATENVLACVKVGKLMAEAEFARVAAQAAAAGHGMIQKFLAENEAEYFNRRKERIIAASEAEVEAKAAAARRAIAASKAAAAEFVKAGAGAKATAASKAAAAAAKFLG